MAIPNHTSLFVLIAIAINIGISTVRSSSTHAHAPAITINRFIWRSCKATQYNRLCYASLSSHAKSIGKDRTRLAISAVEVSESRIRLLSAHVKSISSSRVNNPRTQAALGDCIETLSDAEDLTRQSVRELKALKKAKGVDVAWHVGNAQTWLSAAITNEETCKEGISSDGEASSTGGVGSNVMNGVICRVKKVERFSSNALALVNSLVNSLVSR